MLRRFDLRYRRNLACNAGPTCVTPVSAIFHRAGRLFLFFVVDFYFCTVVITVTVIVVFVAGFVKLSHASWVDPKRMPPKKNIPSNSSSRDSIGGPTMGELLDLLRQQSNQMAQQQEQFQQQ
ncbi:hypothetical protein AgCh_025363 [Apium graveolens]